MTDTLVDKELEKRLLGAVLSAPDVILAARRELLPDELSEKENRYTYEVMLQLAEEKVRPSPDNVKLKIQDLGWEDRVGGIGRIGKLSNMMLGMGPSPEVDAPVWAERLANLAYRRQLLSVAETVQEKALDMKCDPNDLRNAVVDKIIKGKKRMADEYEPLGGVVKDAMQLVRSWLKGEQPDTVPTGIDKVDFALGGGLPKGKLTILGGRPGTAKTLLSEIIADEVESRGGTVVFESLEMATIDIAIRDLCRKAEVDSQKLRRGDYVNDPDIKMRLEQAAIRVGNRLGTLVQDESMRTTADMHWSAMMVDLERGVDLHIVDYVELTGDVRGDAGEEDDRAGVVMAHRRLKALAKSIGCSELVLSQMTRKSVTNPGLSGLMWGGEPVADLVIVTMWPWKLMQQGEIGHCPPNVRQDYNGDPAEDAFYLIVRKHRNGQEGRIELSINPELGQITGYTSGVTVRGRR